MTTQINPLADKKARLRFNRSLKEKGVPAKCCSRCLTVKALSQFGSKGGGKLRAECRSCEAARSADYKARNPEKVRAKDRERNAQRRADPEYKAQERAQQRQYDAQRRSDPEYREKERQANAQRRDRYRAKWTAPDGSLIEGDLSAPKRCTTVTNGGCGRMLTRGDFYGKRDTPDGRDPLCKECQARRKAADRIKILDALIDEGHDRCHLCQGPFLEGDEAHIEHIHPRADEGEPDDLANLALAHDACNLAKGSRDPWEVLPETLAEAGIDFHAAVRALRTYGQVVADLDDSALG